ncbi:MAG: TnpV protein [Clostridia bacterium]|nr:TnpV protein [Clostridia bacterium]
MTYTKKGDYYIPNLTLAKNKYSDYKLSKYGRMRARYLKEYKKAEYTILLIDGKLDEHLYNTDIECKKRYDLLMKKFAEKENITEELKANNQMEWVQKMNNIKNSVEEIIFKELIFV